MGWDALLWFLGSAAFVVGAVFVHQRRGAAWDSVAWQYGLRRRAPRWFQQELMSGEVRGHDVRVETHSREAGNGSKTWTRVEVRHRLPGGAWIHPRGVKPAAAPLGLVDPVETGDPHFDSRLSLLGPRAAVRSTLDAASRRALLNAFASFPIVVERGLVHWEARSVAVRAAVLGTAVGRALDVADALAPGPLGVRERLLAIGRDDPLPEVRRRCLQELLRDADDGDADRLCAIARQDESPRVQDLALREELRRAESPAWADIAPFAARLDNADRLFAARLVHRHRLAEGRAAMAELLSGTPEVAAAAATALGEVGTRDDLPALRSLARRRDDLLRRVAASAAADAIQERLGVVDGGLAVVPLPTGAGGLSELDAEGGLSEAEKSDLDP